MSNNSDTLQQELSKTLDVFSHSTDYTPCQIRSSLFLKTFPHEYFLRDSNSRTCKNVEFFKALIEHYKLKKGDYVVSEDRLSGPRTKTSLQFDSNASFFANLKIDEERSVIFKYQDWFVPAISKFYYKNFSDRDFIIRLSKEILAIREPFLQKQKKNAVNILCRHNSSFALKSFPVKTTNLNISDNYNEDFLEINDKILDKLKTEDHGIIILHGLPGTGKTTYIRYLATNPELEFKTKIYVPPNFANALSDPSFITFLLKHPDSILIIEDAESVLFSRNKASNSQAVSNLLNLSDGLLSDCLKMQIICTLNTNIENIDSALLRKGRLIAKYNFEKLSIEKSNALLKKNGEDYVTKTTMSIGEIYNISEKEYKSDVISDEDLNKYVL